MKKVIIPVVAIILIFAVVVGVFSTSKIPEPKSAEEISHLGDFIEDFKTEDSLYVIDSGTFKSIEERHLAVSLQGIVAKKTPLIFIITNDMDRKYLEKISESGIELIYNDKKGEQWTIATLLKEFKDYIGDNGYTLYTESEKGEGLNIATNLASLYGWLPVHKSLEKLAKDADLELKEDLLEKEYNVALQEEYFEKYKNEFNCKAVVSLKYEATGLRDLAIQQGFYMFYIDDDEDTDELRSKIIDYAGDNVPVLGWAKYEVEYVTQASENGNMVIPSDHSHNNSFLASFDYKIPEQPHNQTKEYTDKTKHYCALVFSDGDNVQWIQNGYSEYFEKLSLKTQFPITWSFSPFMQEFSPVTANMVYSSATENDYFIAGVSGAGYMHPTEYPLDALAEFTDLTSSMMAKNGLSYVSILDNTPDGFVDDKIIEHRLGYYARYDNIKGGVLSLDPERYEGGKGKVYFANDKPFVSNRLSLWHPDGEGANVTEEWLKEQADIVNSYPADIETINGYSVINVHPWTISVENLAYFVSQLDDDVQLVTLDELLTMVGNNIPHKTVTPEN